MYLTLITISTAFIALAVLLALAAAYNKSMRARKNNDESESKFRSLFEESSDEIYVIDFEEHFLEVNKVICNALGYSRAELLHMQVKDIKSDSYGDIAGSLLDKLKKDGYLVFESEHISKKGGRIPVEIKSRIIDYGGGKAILSIARDITERKQLERKILNAILETEENERERFAKDLHDGLGPLLSSIEIYINIIQSGKAGPDEVNKLLDYIKGLTAEANLNVKEISNNLRPSVISRFGLIAAINSVCDKLNKTGVVAVSIQADAFPDKKVSKDVEVTLFRVVNELINNTLKHAYAKKISIRFGLEKEQLMLLYSDDGIGFDFHDMQKNESHKGMGLSNITSRISSIDGHIRFSRNISGGTDVTITLSL
jgi:PAS domain S-box-containing protein